MTDKPELQVLISTFGKNGIERVVKADHPQVPGVEYLVSWQLPDGDEAIPNKLLRPDFKIVKTASRGISRNRNNALKEATAPLCLISDDDVTYTVERLRAIINSFSRNPEADIITFKYHSERKNKIYPPEEFSLDNPPKGYFVSSIEIAFRREAVAKTGILFNENYGIGGEFMAYEELIFIKDLLHAGLSGIFLPITIAEHPELPSGQSNTNNPDFIKATGAAYIHLYKYTWPLRMIKRAWCNYNPDKVSESGFPPLSRFRYIRLWIQGAIKGYSLKKSL